MRDALSVLRAGLYWAGIAPLVLAFWVALLVLGLGEWLWPERDAGKEGGGA